ncbi:hypothetical protein JAAARDRAFT_333684 [Jaapia argillacea MUCL 33604]|uniref:Uncharacterized protein n=1 Tax=Jaapia argillacea MUCL 33604 TaxID=933084 RepID=A0A067PKI8_9AGAM|nr:hypothetical protein JAAARDRAFT_333684 [Jaapia argillacea MUCL 33604]
MYRLRGLFVESPEFDLCNLQSLWIRFQLKNSTKLAVGLMKACRDCLSLSRLNGAQDAVAGMKVVRGPSCCSSNRSLKNSNCIGLGQTCLAAVGWSCTSSLIPEVYRLSLSPGGASRLPILIRELAARPPVWEFRSPNASNFVETAGRDPTPRRTDKQWDSMLTSQWGHMLPMVYLGDGAEASIHCWSSTPRPVDGEAPTSNSLSKCVDVTNASFNSRFSEAPTKELCSTASGREASNPGLPTSSPSASSSTH